MEGRGKEKEKMPARGLGLKDINDSAFRVFRWFRWFRL